MCGWVALQGGLWELGLSTNGKHMSGISALTPPGPAHREGFLVKAGSTVPQPSAELGPEARARS